MFFENSVVVQCWKAVAWIDGSCLVAAAQPAPTGWQATQEGAATAQHTGALPPAGQHSGVSGPHPDLWDDALWRPSPGTPAPGSPGHAGGRRSRPTLQPGAGPRWSARGPLLAPSSRLLGAPATVTEPLPATTTLCGATRGRGLLAGQWGHPIAAGRGAGKAVSTTPGATYHRGLCIEWNLVSERDWDTIERGRASPGVGSEGDPPTPSTAPRSGSLCRRGSFSPFGACYLRQRG